MQTPDSYTDCNGLFSRKLAQAARVQQSAPHLEEEVDRCREDKRAESAPVKLPNELRRPGMTAALNDLRFELRRKRITNCPVYTRAKHRSSSASDVVG